MSFSGDGNGLQNADDVLLNNAADKQTLEYNSASQKWRNVQPRAEVFVNVKDFGAVGDNTGDDSVYIQAAVDSLPTSGAFVGGTVVIPAGSYRLTSPIVLKTGVAVVGAGRRASRLRVEGGIGAFTWTATINQVLVRDLQVSCLSGHIFAPSGGAADWGIYTTTITRCVLTQQDITKSIMHHVSSHDYDNVEFSDCDITRAAGATVPGFNIINSVGAANANRWMNCWWNSQNSVGAPFLYLESTAVSSYAYDNFISNITGEQNPGGLIDLRNNFGTTIDNIVDWDATTNYVTDLIRAGSSTAVPTLRSRYITIKDSGRRGGTLDPGVYDINLVPGQTNRCTLISPNHSTEPNNGIRLNFSNTGEHTIIGAPPSGGVWPNQPASTSAYFGSRVQFESGIVLGQSSVATGAGSPEGVISAPIGSMFLRSDGGVGSTFYVKEAGAGSTGWSAK